MPKVKYLLAYKMKCALINESNYTIMQQLYTQG